MISSPSLNRLGPPSSASLLLLAGLLVSCSGGHEVTRSEKPDVVLIVIDTLRADRLSFHGCPRENAPFLAELASRGLVYEQAQAPGPWTVPSTASLLTSTYPMQHGVVDGFDFGAPEEELVGEQVNRLPSAVETLPEMMRALGYRTYGVSANVLVGFEMGFERGFDRFVALDDDVAETVNAALLEWREEITSEGRPSFLYLHYFDPHDPYYAREPWFDPAGLEAPDPTSESAFARLRAGVWQGLDEERRQDLGRYMPRMLGLDDDETIPAKALANPLDWVLASYDSEIRYCDEHLRSLFEALEIGDETLVVLTSDHGEEFLDHGEWEHGQSLYAELVNVPLVIALPGPDAPRGRVSGPVSTMDVMPTLRAYLGGGSSTQDRGRDLLLASDELRAVFTMNVDLPRSDDNRERSGSQVVGVIRGPWKGIVGSQHRRRRPREYRELYHLAEDPAELAERADSDPEVLESLRSEWERLRAEATIYEREFGSVLVDEAIRHHMEGLGYTDSGED